MKDSTGIFSMDRSDYDRSSRVNWSTLKHIERSPAHYREALLNRGKDTDPKKRGRATHVAVFEPDRFRENYIVWDGDRRAGKDWEKFKEKHESFGREILTVGMHEAAVAIAQAARANAQAMKYLAGGQGERTILWDHVAPAIGGLPGYTVRMKGRPDFIAQCGALVDLKTSKNASPEGFAREVLNYGYHCQAALYIDGLAAATAQPRLPYVYVVVEPEPPYACTVFRVPDAIIEMGRKKYRELLDRLQACVEMNHWPAYCEEEVELALPPWAGGGDGVSDLGLEIG